MSEYKRCSGCPQGVPDDATYCGDCNARVRNWADDTQARAVKIRKLVDTELKSIVGWLIGKGCGEPDAIDQVASYAGRFHGRRYNTMSPVVEEVEAPSGELFVVRADGEEGETWAVCAFGAEDAANKYCEWAQSLNDERATDPIPEGRGMYGPNRPTDADPEWRGGPWGTKYMVVAVKRGVARNV